MPHNVRHFFFQPNGPVFYLIEANVILLDEFFVYLLIMDQHYNLVLILALNGDCRARLGLRRPLLGPRYYRERLPNQPAMIRL